MDILNQIKTVLNQINADGSLNEARLDALAEALSKLDAVAAESPDALRAKLLLLSEQNKELRAAPAAAPTTAAPTAAKAKIKWRGERYEVSPGTPQILRDEKGRTAVAYASKNEARRAVHAALHPETIILGMVDPQAAEAAFLARRGETDDALAGMRARREATYPSSTKKWYKYAGVALAGAAAVGLGYVVAEEASSRWAAHKAKKTTKA